MWKNYLKYQNRKSLLEKSLIFSAPNLYKTPIVKKVIVTTLATNCSNLKEILLCLSGVQIFLNKKSYILKTRNHNARLKTQKGIPIGGKITLNKTKSQALTQLLAFNIFPQLDLINFFSFKKAEQHLNFHLKNLQILRRLTKVYTNYQNLPEIQIKLQDTGKKEKNTMLWRFLRLPLTAAIKNKTFLNS